MSLATLFALSGFAGLIYQVVWLRELGLLFGSTAEATAATLAVFFGGLAVGQRWLAERAVSLKAPLSVYGLLEIALAATAGLHRFIEPAREAIFAVVFDPVYEFPIVVVAAKLSIAALLLGPSAVLMGGTLPVMIEASTRSPKPFAKATYLYAANTFGAAAGALAAGFWLPFVLGYRGTCYAAMAISLAVGLAALALERSKRHRSIVPRNLRAAGVVPHSRVSIVLVIVALVSGIVALALEVLWTRMFAQVLHNSVYSFALIVVTFLVGLAIGAVVAARLPADESVAARTLAGLLLASAIGVASTPLTMNFMTTGLEYVARDLGWYGYLASVARLAIVVLLVPTVLVGAVFPYTWRVAETQAEPLGRLVGRLAAWNSIGAVVGPVFVGFVVLPALGLWRCIIALALVYAGLGLVFAVRSRALALELAAIGATLSACILSLVIELPVVYTATSKGDRVLDLSETAYGTVAVVERGDRRSLRIDNYYTVGGNGAPENDRRQAYLPILAHPDPRSVYFLGMGTGITAAASLRHPIDRVVTAELVPTIVDAATRYFGDYAEALFTDRRSEVVVADGRHHLASRGESYDVVISDMFIPWQSGASELYSHEHFQNVRARLSDRGIFALWLPLYQLSIQEFSIIARTMLEAFPLVTLWRGDFLAGTPIVAIFGHAAGDDAVDPDLVVANMSRMRGVGPIPADTARALVFLFYCANLTAASEVFDPYPVNTDDHPFIAFQAPITQREVAAGRRSWLTSESLVAFLDDLAARAPPTSDPYLRHLTESDRRHVDAGRSLHAIFAHADAEHWNLARDRFQRFVDSASVDVYRMYRDQIPSLSPGDEIP